MFAEISTRNSNRKFNTAVLKCVNNQIITTIPTLKNENICFLPDEIIYISIPFSSSIYSFEATFKEIKKIKDRFFFTFDLIKNYEKNNIRKDKRIHTDLPAILNQPSATDFSFACILDASKNGFKIETSEAINRRIFHISFQNGESKETKRVKIAWTKKLGNIYHYGLQTVL